MIDCTKTGQLRALLEKLNDNELFWLKYHWPLWAHSFQLPPPGDWNVWLILGGRGAGKTRAGAEWVRGEAQGQGQGQEHAQGLETPLRIALIGETYAAAREIMVEGPSGILAVHPPGFSPEWLPSRRRLEWPGGTVAEIFSASDPQALRGPQFDLAWCDELAKWPHGDEAWNMLQFGMRRGERPRQLVTTTPRPTELIKLLVDDPMTVTHQAATQENAAYLSPAFLSKITRRYAGSHLGRQELEGILITDQPNALFSRKMLENCRCRDHPPLIRILIGVDPPASSGPDASACGIIAAGLATDGLAYVLEDASVENAKPHIWGRRVVEIYERQKADFILAETNQGGEMVVEILRQFNSRLPIRRVHARHGKWSRAEPVAVLYEQGKIRHLAGLARLEDEMNSFTRELAARGRSPDRLDALVWAISTLCLEPQVAPRLRSI